MLMVGDYIYIDYPSLQIASGYAKVTKVSENNIYFAVFCNKAWKPYLNATDDEDFITFHITILKCKEYLKIGSIKKVDEATILTGLL